MSPTLEATPPALAQLPAPSPPASARGGDSGSASVACTIPGLLRFRSQATPDGVAYAYADAQGARHARTWAELRREVRAIGAAFMRSGLVAGERIAVIAPTSRAWDLLQLGASSIGLVVVGIDDRSSPADLEAQLLDAQPRALVVQHVRQLAAIPGGIRSQLKLTVAIATTTTPESGASEPRPDSGPAPVDWEELLACVAPAHEPEVGPHDPATLIYTSGTTGAPKAIVYDHGQVLVACEAICAALAFADEPGATVCWMPLANLFQRMLNLVAMRAGATVCFVDDPRTLIGQLPTLEPTFLVGVPRFYEKLMGAIEQRIAAQPAWRRALTRWAMRIGARHHGVAAGRWSPVPLRHALAERLALRRLRAALGGRLRFLITGSAPTPIALFGFFASLGVPLLEAYGTSENTVPIAMNTLAARRFGSVGRPLAPNQVAIAEDGEVLVKGPGLFRGYAGERDAGRWTDEGFYKTGDAGAFDRDGFLVLTGRTRDLIKTSSGRRIAPARVEERFSVIAGVDHAIVIGHGRKHLVGLLSLVPGTIAGCTGGADALRARLAAGLRRANAVATAHERVWRWGIIERPLSPERGELTLNGKLRRDRIAAEHAPLIEALYADLPARAAADPAILRLDPGPGGVADP